MWLLNASTYALEEFMNEKTIPEYAILSHTWGAGEVTFQELSGGLTQRIEQKAGFAKIELTCEQAKNDGLEYCWVDTCFIDKTSSAELSETINSMFRWYARSTVCYAYLEDVEVVSGAASEFERSRWFTRGWTLQELIAPQAIEFYGASWTHFGTSSLLASEISKITNIDIEVLRKERRLRDVCVARRMSWAAGRQTTRTEDMAYCLLGVFDVNMPLLYGEGNKAFYRLQEQILGDSTDDSLFAWNYFEPEHEVEQFNFDYALLAPSPNSFKHYRRFWQCRPTAWDDVIELTSNGVRLKTHYIGGQALKDIYRAGPYPKYGEVALLNCYSEDAPNLRYVLHLQPYSQGGPTSTGYSVCPQALHSNGYQDSRQAMSIGLCTRLGLVDRYGGQGTVPQATRLITKAFLGDSFPLRVRISLSPKDALEFKQVVCPPYTYKGDRKSSSLIETTYGTARRFEFSSGSFWSMRIPERAPKKIITVVARILNVASNVSFTLIRHYALEASEVGDYGIKMLISDNENIDDAALWARHAGLLSYKAKKKQCSINLNADTVMADCNVNDFEGPTIEVRVRLDKPKPDAKTPQKEGVGKRISRWATKA